MLRPAAGSTEGPADAGSTVHLAEDDIHGANERGHVGQKMALGDVVHGLQMQGESDLRGCKKAFTALVGKEMPADNATLAAGLKWLAELDLTGLNLTKQDLTESAQSQSSHLHWLLGEHDPLVPVTVAEQLPGQVEVLSDCGHLPMLTQTEVLAEHLLSIIKAADDEQ